MELKPCRMTGADRQAVTTVGAADRKGIAGDIVDKEALRVGRASTIWPTRA